MKRSDSLDRFSDASEWWDVIVIGGGASGLGVAVDAAHRGYRVALLEQADFCESTSSKSTKLIHGGVRYLRGGEVGLVRESLRERGRLLKNASGLVKPLPFVVPAYRFYERAYYGIGLSLYDALAGNLGIESTGHFSKKRVLERVPNLNEAGLYGGTHYWDGQFDDARLAIALAQTAVRGGAAVANRMRVLRLVKEGDRVAGVEAEDTESGRIFTLKGKVVVNATGVFSDSVRKMDDPSNGSIIAPSQGIHLVLDQKFLGGETAIMIPSTDDGRVLFAIPWHNRMLLGTTDTGGVKAELCPRPMQEEVAYLIDHAGRYLAEKPRLSDVRSQFAGLRPLVVPSKAAKGATSKISRSHNLSASRSGLVTIAGGKWTTYRQMAEDTVDLAIQVGTLEAQPCITHDLTLLDGAREDEGHDERLHPELPYDGEDVRRAVEDEMALSLDDVLSRRLRCSLLDVEATRAIVPEVVQQMASLLGRDEAWMSKEEASFLEKLKCYSEPRSQSPSSSESDGS